VFEGHQDSEKLMYSLMRHAANLVQGIMVCNIDARDRNGYILLWRSVSSFHFVSGMTNLTSHLHSS